MRILVANAIVGEEWHEAEKNSNIKFREGEAFKVENESVNDLERACTRTHGSLALATSFSRDKLSRRRKGDNDGKKEHFSHHQVHQPFVSQHYRNPSAERI